MIQKFLQVAVVIATATFAAASEKPVKMSDLPSNVRQAIERVTKGATVRGLSKETERGKTYYEAETIVNGRHRDLLFDEAGNTAEIEEQISLDSIPAPAKRAIEQHAAGGKVLKVEAVTAGKRTNYEAEIQKAGKKSELKVSADGRVVK